MQKSTVLKICGVVIAGSCAGLWWVWGELRLKEDGNDLVVFNDTSEAVEVEIDGEVRSLDAEETWRVRVGAGEHPVRVADEVRTIELGWDRSTVLVPVEPATLAAVDVSGAYVDFAAGHMMGDSSIESLHEPAPYVVFAEPWVLSPYEPMPESVSGAPPLATFLIPDGLEEPEAIVQALTP